MTYHLAQINIARLRFALDDPQMAEFVAVLEPINQIAEITPGFVWRLTGDDGRSATYAQHAFDPNIIVNFSVWESLESLKHFVPIWSRLVLSASFGLVRAARETWHGDVVDSSGPHSHTRGGQTPVRPPARAWSERVCVWLQG
jgi:Domain of unknown function (DUF3291)